MAGRSFETESGTGQGHTGAARLSGDGHWLGSHGDRPDRREFLKAVGAGLGAALVGGCSPPPVELDDLRFPKPSIYEESWGHRRSATARRLASPSSASTVPSILFVLVDQERSVHLRGRDLRRLVKGFGNEASLPGRRSFSSNGYRVVEFQEAYCAAPLCSPSRASLLTGLLPGKRRGTTGVTTNTDGVVVANPPLDVRIPTLGTELRRVGYQTAYFGKWHLSTPGSSSPSALSAYGFDHAEHFTAWCGVPAYAPSDLPSSSCDRSIDPGAITDEKIVAAALAYITKASEERKPWFVVVSLMNPHDIEFSAAYAKPNVLPVLPDALLSPKERCEPSCFVDGDPSRARSLPFNFGNVSGKPLWQGTTRIPGPASEDALRQYLAEYAGLIELTDQTLVGLYAAAQQRGALLVYASDHGEMAGSHSMLSKGNNLYDETWRVPLFFAHPSLRDDGPCAGLVSLVDLAPTLLGLVGERWKPETAGNDLSGYLLGRTDAIARTFVYGAVGYSLGELVGKRNESRSVVGYRTRSRKWARYDFAISSKTGQITHKLELEVYDLERDPCELVNLAAGGALEEEDRRVLAHLQTPV
jgi:arylsulfatase A-like enzyme